MAAEEGVEPGVAAAHDGGQPLDRVAGVAAVDGLDHVEAGHLQIVIQIAPAVIVVGVLEWHRGGRRGGGLEAVDPGADEAVLDVFERFAGGGHGAVGPERLAGALFADGQQRPGAGAVGAIGGALLDQLGERGAGGGQAARGHPEFGAENGELGTGFFAVAEGALEAVERGFAAGGVAGAEDAFDGVEGRGGRERAAIDVDGAEALVEAAAEAFEVQRSIGCVDLAEADGGQQGECLGDEGLARVAVGEPLGEFLEAGGVFGERGAAGGGEFLDEHGGTAAVDLQAQAPHLLAELREDLLGAEEPAAGLQVAAAGEGDAAVAEAEDAGGADAVVYRFAAETVGIDGVVLALFFLEAELELIAGGVEIPGGFVEQAAVAAPEAAVVAGEGEGAVAGEIGGGQVVIDEVAHAFDDAAGFGGLVGAELGLGVGHGAPDALAEEAAGCVGIG